MGRSAMCNKTDRTARHRNPLVGQSIGPRKAANAQRFLYVPLPAFSAADGCLENGPAANSRNLLKSLHGSDGTLEMFCKNPGFVESLKQNWQLSRRVSPVAYRVGPSQQHK